MVRLPLHDGYSVRQMKLQKLKRPLQCFGRRDVRGTMSHRHSVFLVQDPVDRNEMVQSSPVGLPFRRPVEPDAGRSKRAGH